MSKCTKPKQALLAAGTPSERLSRLLNLFYGLAISTGFGLTLRGSFSGSIPASTSCFLFLTFAFTVALCDWVIYHFAVAPFAYQGLFRVILDLLFPIGLFVISLHVNDTFAILRLLFGYFALSAVYALISAHEVTKLPRLNTYLGFWSAGVCLGAAILYHEGYLSDTKAAWSFGILAAIPWFCFWFYWLRSVLCPKPDIVATSEHGNQVDSCV